MTKEYIIENFTANISVDEYISRFRDEKRFVEFCKQWRVCQKAQNALNINQNSQL